MKENKYMLNYSALLNLKKIGIKTSNENRNYKKCFAEINHRNSRLN